MKKHRFTFLIALSLLGVMGLWNNCGSYHLNSKSETTGNQNLAKTFALTGTDPEQDINLISVSPETVTVAVNSLNKTYECSWSGLVERGINSLADIGGMTSVVFIITNDSCSLETNDEHISEFQKGIVQNAYLEKVQSICFVINKSERMCYPFTQNPIWQNVPDPVEDLSHGPPRRRHIFDSQNG